MRNICLVLIILTATPAWTKPAKAKDDSIAITVSAAGNDIAFDKHEIHVKSGRKIRLRFINGAKAGSDILHDIAILKPGTQDEVLLSLQKDGYNLEKIHRHPSIIALSKTLSPAEEDVVEISSLAPGVYPYVCLMAGHADMLGMKGSLIVTP